MAYSEPIGPADYQDYIQSPDWLFNEARIIAMRRYGGRCTLCQAKAVHAHHRTYERAGGFEASGDLIPLCNFHHSAAHGKP